MIALLIAVTCLSQFYRVSNSVIAPELARDLHLSARQIGWAGSAFFFALFAVQLPVGLWFDRFGARRTVSAVSLLAVVGSIWIAHATDAADLIAGRIIVGVGCAASFMSVVFLCARWFSARELSTALSVGVRGLQHRHPGRRHAARLGRRRRRLAQRLPRPRRRHADRRRSCSTSSCATGRPSSTLPTTHKEPLREVFRGLWQVWRTKGLLPLLSMHFFAYATMLTVLGVWGGPYLFDVHKLDGVQRGNVLLAMGVAQTLGILTYGPMDRVLRSRKKA